MEVVYCQKCVFDYGQAQLFMMSNPSLIACKFHGPVEWTKFVQYIAGLDQSNQPKED